MLHLQVSVTNPAELLAAGAYGPGALLRWESSPTGTGSWTEGGTAALAADATLYDVWDPAGAVGTWYRTRVSNAANTVDSDYSAAFQGGVPTRYAELDDLLPLFETAPLPRRYGRLLSLLDTATRQVVEECGGRDYFRKPATGTATWLANGNGTATLHVHEGLVQLDLLELSFDGGRTYVTVAATDYILVGDSPSSTEPPPPGEPFFHVRFTGFGSYTTFPPVVRAARLTGARGWSRWPVTLTEATAQRARQLAFASAGYSGSEAGGQDEFGRTSATDRFWPQSLYNFLSRDHERFIGCSVAAPGGWTR